MNTKTASSPANPSSVLPDPDDAPAKRRVLLVDDHPVTRDGLKALINQQLNLVVCGETDNAAHAAELVSAIQPDLVLVDVALKTTSGIELTKNLATQAPKVPVLVVSMHDENIYAERALRAGAKGYVMKQEAGDKVVAAIDRVLSGEIFLGERMKDRVLHSVVKKRGGEQNVFPIDTLSDREAEVFQLIGDGFSTRQIAEKLNLSSKTIDSYREHLKLKLNLASGSELMRHAIEWGRNVGNA